MRSTDTARQLELPFAPAGEAASGAVTGPRLRPGDVDSATGGSTPTTATTPGIRTSATAIRTTTTRTTAFGPVPSADEPAAVPADLSFEEVVAGYVDCRRNKRTKAAALEFERNQEAGLFAIYAALTNGTWRPGRSICFVVTRPRPREVWRAEFRDRVVHHILYNRIAPRFHAGFIADSCACIPGRGTLYAARRLEHHVRSATHNWSRPAFYLKLDFANFFVSIDKHVLREQLARRIPEPWWLRLAETVLYHDPRVDVALHSTPAQLALVPPHKSLLHQPAHLGLPIGNLSSQFFANVHLDSLDQFVKHRLGARHYVRYVDDLVLVHASPQWLNAARADIEAFAARELHLWLNQAKTVLQPVERGIDFVGHLIKPWCRRTRPRTVRQALARVARLPAADLRVTANSYFGLLRQAPASHTDRTRLANLLRQRGRSVDHRLTKSYAPAQGALS